MKNNRISEEFSDEDLEAVLGAIGVIDKRMPWLLTLTPEESRGLRNLGFDGLPFAMAALDAVRANIDFTRRGFDLEEFEKDVTLYHKLSQVRARLAPLAQKVTQTAQVAGSDMMVTSDDIYEDITRDNGETAAVQAARQQMKKRYPQRKIAEKKAKKTDL